MCVCVYSGSSYVLPSGLQYHMSRSLIATLRLLTNSMTSGYAGTAATTTTTPPRRRRQLLSRPRLEKFLFLLLLLLLLRLLLRLLLLLFCLLCLLLKLFLLLLLHLLPLFLLLFLLPLLVLLLLLLLRLLLLSPTPSSSTDRNDGDDDDDCHCNLQTGMGSTLGAKTPNTPQNPNARPLGGSWKPTTKCQSAVGLAAAAQSAQLTLHRT